jgi:hypothetical protein
MSSWAPGQALNDWQLMLHGVYGDRNSERDQYKLFAHLVEVAGGFSKATRKGLPALAPNYLAKLFAWLCALATKLGYRDLETVVWQKYPHACPYCQSAVCNCPPADRPPLQHTAVRRLQSENRHLRPRALSGWQAMFRDVYGVPSSFLGQAGTAAPGTRLQLVAGSNRLHEELSELAEAMRLEHVFPIAVTSELADVFGWMMAVANVLPTRMACR